ncbi:MAG: hypothetical protein ABSC01_08190 [Verrucomicrobiota bacterium]|jgi:hypothetical protein
MIAIESPLLQFGQDFAEVTGAPTNKVSGVGEEPFISYTELMCVFAPLVFSITEMSDNEVVQLAESSASFAFLDSPEEDIYNDLLKSKE